jgi:hypothetical protein
MNTVEMNFSPELIAKIVRCVEDAVGDDILTDIQANGLQTRNSVPSRIWDLLNTNLVKSLEMEDCTVAKAHRGPWEMLIIYEKTSQYIFTFMREKRFAELRKRQVKRKSMHYIDMLAKQFNRDLIADQQQTSFFPSIFSDDDRLPELIQTLLYDLGGGSDVVCHHVLVLFETAGYQLTHIRAVMVTPNLDVAHGCEQNWSRYIAATESIIVPKISDPEAPENQPSRGLSLKPKAIARKKQKPQLRDALQEQGGIG